MIAETASRALKAALYGQALPVFAVIDGAGCPALLPMLERHGLEFACLYRGELEPELMEAAPHLARLDPDSPFTQWFLSEGWGRHWGIFLLADATLSEIRRHLRRLILVRLPDHQVVYFRFYDPRVLRTYLPTCTPEEARQFFGPVQTILAEAEEATSLLRMVQGPAGVLVAHLPLDA